MESDASSRCAQLFAEPFRPFRIRITSGRNFEIRHPEMVRVGADSVIIFTTVSDDPEIYDKMGNGIAISA